MTDIDRRNRLTLDYERMAELLLAMDESEPGCISWPRDGYDRLQCRRLIHQELAKPARMTSGKHVAITLRGGAWLQHVKRATNKGAALRKLWMTGRHLFDDEHMDDEHASMASDGLFGPSLDPARNKSRIAGTMQDDGSTDKELPKSARSGIRRRFS